MDEIRAYLCDPKIGVLSVNETWLDDSVTDDEVAIPGFTIFRNDRMSGRHGGVALYVRNHFYPELLPHLLNTNVESVFVKIRVGNTPCLVGSLYRPPQTNVATHEIIVKHIEKAINLNYKTIIMGDFNLDINDTRKKNIVNEIELLFQLKQLIKDYTRVTENSATTIDLIFTNLPFCNHIESGVIPCSPSDHFFVYFTISWKNPFKSNLHKYTYKRHMKRFCETHFLNDIRDSNILKNIYSCQDTNQSWSIWKNEFLKICNFHAPLKLCRVKRTSGPWVTDKILELIYHRNFLHKKANCSKNKNDYIIYKKVRNCVISEVKKANKSFYTKAIKTSKSSHDIWKALKTVLPNKIPDNIDPNLNANKFNEYFGSIGSNLTKDLNNQDYKVFPTRSDINFHFHHYNTAFVSKCLLGLRKNSSLDILEFDTTLLKLAALFIAPSIGHICNLSLNQGTVP